MPSPCTPASIAKSTSFRKLASSSSPFSSNGVSKIGTTPNNTPRNSAIVLVSASTVDDLEMRREQYPEVAEHSRTGDWILDASKRIGYRNAETPTSAQIAHRAIRIQDQLPEPARQRALFDRENRFRNRREVRWRPFGDLP